MVAVNKEMAELKKQVAGAPASEVVVVEADSMEVEQDEFEHTIDELQGFINTCDPSRPKSRETIEMHKKQMEIQREAKRASKPPQHQINHAEREIRKMQKKAAALQVQTDVLSEAANRAHNILNAHLDEVAKLQGEIITATQRKEALSKRLLLANSTAGSPDPAQDASQLLLQLQSVLQKSGLDEALPGTSDETRVILHSLCQRASDEIEARRLAKAEADAAAAAARAAAVPTPVPTQATEATKTGAPAATAAATAAAPGTATSHSRPPPSLGVTEETTLPHASRSSWPDGDDTLVPVPIAPPGQSGFDQQFAILEAITAGNATPEQQAAGPAIMESFRSYRNAPY